MSPAAASRTSCTRSPAPPGSPLPLRPMTPPLSPPPLCPPRISLLSHNFSPHKKAACLPRIPLFYLFSFSFHRSCIAKIANAPAAINTPASSIAAPIAPAMAARRSSFESADDSHGRSAPTCVALWVPRTRPGNLSFRRFPTSYYIRYMLCGLFARRAFPAAAHSPRQKADLLMHLAQRLGRRTARDLRVLAQDPFEVALVAANRAVFLLQGSQLGNHRLAHAVL